MKRLIKPLLIVLCIGLLAVLTFLFEPAFANLQMQKWVFRDMSKELVDHTGTEEAATELETFYTQVDKIRAGETDIRDAFPQTSDLMFKPTLNNQMQAPFDLKYYASPKDSQPAYVIPKGTTIYLEENASLATASKNDIYCYGLVSLPTREKGWRLVVPFLVEGQKSNDTAYYVRLNDLVRLQQIRYRTEKTQSGTALSLKAYVKENSEFRKMPQVVSFYQTLLRVDMDLARSESPKLTQDLYRPALPLWAVIALAGACVLANILLVVKGFRKRTHLQL
ncbi:MAG: hypothetical protein IJM90_00910 [Firmicutes bacterium]|nr:hypothetical protein [Bacillota bacterium]